MIRLLRSIRLKLLAHDSYSTYLLYAANLWALGSNSYVGIRDHCEKVLDAIELELN